jgi:non-ribosomal peptide synthetase component F/NRPS condensation-like uncharacterized protein
MTAKNIESLYPLTPAQQGMLLLSLASPNSSHFVEQLSFELTGNFDLVCFTRAFQMVVNRHAVLRTAFAWKGLPEPLQAVGREVRLPVIQEDWRNIPESEREKRIEEYLNDDRRKGFNLSRAPLMRIALIRTSDDSYHFVWTHHHLVLDGWSFGVLLRELSEFYNADLNGRQPALEPSVSYERYVHWLREQDLGKTEAFWRDAFANCQLTTFPERIQPSPVNAPADFREEKLSIASEVALRVHTFARQSGLTLSTILQAAWALVLARHTQSDDVLFGVTLSGRPASLPGVEKIIGPFINTLPVRVRIFRDAGVAALLHDLQAYQLELQRYSFTPLLQVHRWAEIPTDAPLFQTLFLFQNYPIDTSQRELIPGARSSSFNYQLRTIYPLTLVISAHGQELHLKIVYDRHYLAAMEASALLQELSVLLGMITENKHGGQMQIADVLDSSEIWMPERFERRMADEANTLPATGSGVQQDENPALQTGLAEIFSSPTEKIVAGLWAKLQRVDRVATSESLLQSGGHSLLILQFIAEVKDIFHIDLPVHEVFTAPTITDLANKIDALKRMDGRFYDGPVPRAHSQTELPLSFAQQRFWFLFLLDPGNPVYNCHFAFRVYGNLNVGVLELSTQEIVRRHEILRTRFSSRDGQVYQYVMPESAFHIPIIDLSEVEKVRRSDLARQLCQQEARRPFNLVSGPLLRVMIFQLGPSESLVLINLHHVVSDSISVALFIRETNYFYNGFVKGERPSLPDLPVQYGDYGIWQRANCSEETMARQLAYWKTQLKELPQQITLPVKQYHTGELRRSGSSRVVAVPQDTSERIRQLARREGATLFMTLLAGFKAVLQWYSGMDDIVVGAPLSSRTHRSLFHLIGFFLNTVVLRTHVSADLSFRQLVRSVRNVALEAYAHQDVPYERLVKEARAEHGADQRSLFQVWFVLEERPRNYLTLGELVLEREPIQGGSVQFDLALLLADTPDGFRGVLEYPTDLFEEEKIAEITHYFVQFLRLAAEQPDRSVFDLQFMVDANGPAVQDQKDQAENFVF